MIAENKDSGKLGAPEQSNDTPSLSTLDRHDGRTETANAARLIDRFGDDIRWCEPWGKWLVWDGKRWKIDNDRSIEALAKQVASNLWVEALPVLRQVPDNTAKAILQFVRASNQANGIRNMVSLAKCDVSIQPSSLDTNQWLLNVANGTLDLQTGELLPHDRQHFITKLCPIAYDPSAQFPVWRGFLRTILQDDKQLVSYIQRLVGYSLTGLTRDHILPFMYGVGSNGKSTFVGVILDMLGTDYAIKAPSDMLLAKKNSHPTEVADLHGKRFVACVEVEDGRRMAESLVKELTGGDKLRARRMREDFWEFSASHKIWLAANHKPRVRGTDHGIWRRIKLLPFTVTIPDDQQDKQLPDKLHAELPGILAWAVEGCRQYVADGLHEPDVVKAATGGYRAEMDMVGNFISECCIEDQQASVGATALFKRYKQWCEDAGERALNQTRFGAQLTERGFDGQKQGGSVLRFGLQLSL
ncbi:MAG: DNA primase family protein [Pirellulaceae bacterium]